MRLSFVEIDGSASSTSLGLGHGGAVCGEVAGDFIPVLCGVDEVKRSSRGRSRTGSE